VETESNNIPSPKLAYGTALTMPMSGIAAFIIHLIISGKLTAFHPAISFSER
jgi:hypothetical protein